MGTMGRWSGVARLPGTVSVWAAAPHGLALRLGPGWLGHLGLTCATAGGHDRQQLTGLSLAEREGAPADQAAPSLSAGSGPAVATPAAGAAATRR